MINVDPIELYDFLKSKNIKYFFHANTTRTACTYIEQKGLVSREFVETNGFTQTSQSSDKIDQKFNVWNDIFLDLFDLHGYFPRQNFYGPVCFQLDNKLLLDCDLPNICITKNNPINWTDAMSDYEKYYQSVKEYAYEFDKNIRSKCIQRKMFTIHDINKNIDFEKYLVKIILDNPKVKVGGVSLFKEAKQKLTDSLIKSGLEKQLLETRGCSNCYCHDNYLKKVEADELKKIFL